VIVLPETLPLRARRWCFLGPLRTRADSIVHYTIHRSQYSTLFYVRAAEGGAGEDEKRRDEGTGEGEVARTRTAGGKAAGAWVIGGLDGRKGMLWRTGVMEGPCAVARGESTNIKGYRSAAGHSTPDAIDSNYVVAAKHGRVSYRFSTISR
jgi:hypothetical protein